MPKTCYLQTVLIWCLYFQASGKKKKTRDVCICISSINGRTVGTCRYVCPLRTPRARPPLDLGRSCHLLEGLQRQRIFCTLIRITNIFFLLECKKLCIKSEWYFFSPIGHLDIYDIIHRPCKIISLIISLLLMHCIHISPAVALTRPDRVILQAFYKLLAGCSQPLQWHKWIRRFIRCIF